MENTAHRDDRKWRLSPGSPGGITAPLAWGVNLWLLLIVFPAYRDGEPLTGRSGLVGIAALVLLMLGGVLATLARTTVASVVWLAAYPGALTCAVALRERADAPGALALVVVTLSMWVFGGSVLSALRPPIGAGSARLLALPEGRRRTSRRAALAARAHHLRTALTAVLGAGALAIGVVAPNVEPRALQREWGAQAPSGSVLIAMAGGALACTVAGVFLSALLRPQSASERVPRSPMRIATGIMLALFGATTYYVVRIP